MLLGGAACASSEGNRVLRDLPPAPLVVVVDADLPPAGAESGLRFAASKAEMTSILAQELRSLDVGSRVIASGEPGSDQADIEIKFRPRSQIQFEHAGATNVLGATGLWLVTWVGGLLVQESTYIVRMDATCAYKVPGERVQFERAVKGGEVDLSFLERNDFMSSSTLQALVLPPFWTSDQADTTSAALTRSSLRMAAREIANELKKDFEGIAETEFKCAVRIRSPQNGKPASGSTMPLSLTASSRSQDPIIKISVSVNGGPSIDMPLSPASGRLVEVSGELKGLSPERENWVRVEVTADKVYTRTIRMPTR